MSADVALGAAVVLATTLCVVRMRSIVRSWRARRRSLRARSGERDARTLLAQHGFEVLAEQAAGALVLHVDGAESVHALRADFLVVRGGRRFVAEVKTGAVAPSLDHAPTRRQILEYCAAFDVDGALLVDPQASRVREIALAAPRAPRAWPWLVLGLAAGIALTWLTRT